MIYGLVFEKNEGKHQKSAEYGSNTEYAFRLARR